MLIMLIYYFEEKYEKIIDLQIKKALKQYFYYRLLTLL